LLGIISRDTDIRKMGYSVVRWPDSALKTLRTKDICKVIIRKHIREMLAPNQLEPNAMPFPHPRTTPSKPKASAPTYPCLRSPGPGYT